MKHAAELLNIPTPPKPERKAQKAAVKKLNKEEKAALDTQLWQAIDAGDAAEVAVLLESGANPNSRRQKIPAVWASVQAGRWEVAKALTDAGAAITTKQVRDPKRYFYGFHMATLWSAIAPSDRIEDAAKVLELGADPAHAGADFLAASSKELFNWWIKAYPEPAAQLLMSHVSRNHYMLGTFAPLAGPEVQRAIVKAIGPADQTTHALIHAVEHLNASKKPHEKVRCDDLLRNAWEKVMRLDDPDKAKELLRSGWAPPETMQAYNGPQPFWQQSTILLRAAAVGAWRMFDWLSQSEALRREASAALEKNPEMGWRIAIDTVTAMEKIDKSGLIDMKALNDKKQNIAHYLFDHSYQLSKVIVDYMVKNHSSLLTQEDANGRTPLTQGSSASSDKYRAYAAKQMMGKTVAKPVVSVPKRRM